MPKVKWYVVTVGTEVGVFSSWTYTSKCVVGVPGAQFCSHKFESEARQAFQKAVDEGAVCTLPPVSAPSTSGTAHTTSSPSSLLATGSTRSVTLDTTTPSSPVSQRKPKPEQKTLMQEPSGTPQYVHISSDESEQEDSPVRYVPKTLIKPRSPPSTRPSSSKASSERRNRVNSRPQSPLAPSSPETGATQYVLSTRSSSPDGSHRISPSFYRKVGSSARDLKTVPLQTSYTYPLNSPGRDKGKAARQATNTSSSLSTWTFNIEDTPIYVIASDDDTEPDTDEEVTYRALPIQKTRQSPQDYLLSPLNSLGLNMTGPPASVSAVRPAQSKSHSQQERASVPSSPLKASASGMFGMAQTSSVAVHSPSFDPRSPISRNVKITGRANPVQFGRPSPTINT